MNVQRYEISFIALEPI